MKHKWLISVALFLLSIALFVVGLYFVPALIIVGLVMFFATLIGSLIFGVATASEQGRREAEKEEAERKKFEKIRAKQDDRTKEQMDIDRINSTYGGENFDAYTEWAESSWEIDYEEIKEWTRSYFGCYVGITFVLLMVAIAVLVIITMVKSDPLYLYIGLGLMGVGALVIVTAALTVVIAEKKSMGRAKRYEKMLARGERCPEFIEDKAKVVASLISSFTQWGGSHSGHRTSTRVSNRVYRILLLCGDKKLTAYSRHRYNKGEVLTIIYKMDSLDASIIFEEEYFLELAKTKNNDDLKNNDVINKDDTANIDDITTNNEDSNNPQ